MNKVISINDIIYDPIRNKLVVVHGFQEDSLGQQGVLFGTSKNLRNKDDRIELTSAWIVFKYFYKVGTL